MIKPKYKLERMHDGWISIYILINNTHYEWVKDVCDMNTANRFVAEN